MSYIVVVLLRIQFNLAETKVLKSAQFLMSLL